MTRRNRESPKVGPNRSRPSLVQYAVAWTEPRTPEDEGFLGSSGKEVGNSKETIQEKL